MERYNSGTRASWIYVSMSLTFLLSACMDEYNDPESTNSLSDRAIPDHQPVGTSSNRPPTISGAVDDASSSPPGNFLLESSLPESSPLNLSLTPPTYALTDEPYFFQPDVVDPNGNPLTFEITNKPPWLSFDVSFGTLSGLPGLGDIGIYSNISISASDGTNTATLGPFSIEVLSSGTRSVTLAWVPPTENDDGSAITDLAGYRIHYGAKLGAYTSAIEINNPGLTTAQIDGLYQEELYFVILAYNSEGSESNFSNAVLVDLR